eukprot:c7771_g1_i2.p1 GENE.c7771_g1_i2~~c7771_g1_i2.p1  ORF type:complete len:502 (+),score=127.63 c7771_g1_i2:41-1507(+)
MSRSEKTSKSSEYTQIHSSAPHHQNHSPINLQPFSNIGSPKSSPSTALLQESLLSQQHPSKNNFLQSFLSKCFRSGSASGAVFNVCSGALGAGALSLPYAFAQAGVAIGLLLLVLGAVATIYSIQLLIHARVCTNLKSYGELTSALFGNTMGVVMEVNIIIFCFGVAVACCRAVVDVIDPVVDIAHLPSFLHHNTKLVMFFFWLAVMFPLSLINKMDSLRFSSFLGVLTIMFLVVATTEHSLRNTHLLSAAHVPWTSTDFWLPTSVSGVIRAAPIMIFAFTCQINVFSIYDELEAANEKKMNHVTHTAAIICAIIYLVMGFFGVAEYNSGTCGNILQNYRDELSHNALIMCSYFGITLTILTGFPLIIFPCRSAIETMLARFCKNSRFLSTDSTLRHVLVTLVVSGASLLLSLFVPSLNVVFELIGGTCSALIAFVMPAAFAIKLRLNSKSMKHQALTWLLAIAGGGVGVVSASLTLYNTIANPSRSC